MKAAITTLMACLMLQIAACGKEPPPRSSVELMQDPILLEATMVRCSQNRNGYKYEKECVNAREAVDRIAVAENERRRKELESQSERKRQALRQAQLAAAEARRRAAEAEKRREEAAYLSQFQPAPEVGGEPSGTLPDPTPPAPALDANQPGVVAADPTAQAAELAGDALQPDSSESDLEAVRQELQSRQEMN